jgi:hypothetical protein
MTPLFVIMPKQACDKVLRGIARRYSERAYEMSVTL